MTRVYKQELIPLQFRNSEKSVFAVTLNNEILNEWLLIIQWLNTLENTKKYDVETIIKKV